MYGNESCIWNSFDTERSGRTDCKSSRLWLHIFDTAEVYGTTEDPHHNEKLLGEVLSPYRNKIVLASKCGIRFDETATTVNKPLIPDGRPETIKASINGSLQRLHTDHLDLYYIHRIDMTVPIEETAGAMKELMEQGKITHWGLSEASEDIIRRAHKVCPVTAIQNRYSMMYRDYEKLFPVLEELNIGFVAFSPLANGLLTAAYHSHGEFERPGDYRSMMPQFTEEGLKENERFMLWIRQLAEEKMPHRHRFLLPGCVQRNRISYQFREQEK